jgi:hypothetical protein
VSPNNDAAPEDPLEIVGVVLERPMDERSIHEMARTFVEEYALMGWGPRRILELFRRPFYAGAHDAYERLGEDRIRALIADTFGSDQERLDA